TRKRRQIALHRRNQCPIVLAVEAVWSSLPRAGDNVRGKTLTKLAGQHVEREVVARPGCSTRVETSLRHEARKEWLGRFEIIGRIACEIPKSADLVDAS